MLLLTIITRLHGGASLPDKDDVESQWKNLKFHPATRKRLNPWLPKLAWVTMSRISTCVQNCISIRLGDFASRMCEVAYQMFTRLLFWVLPTLYTPKAAAPTLTLNAPKDVVSRKDVPFGVLENKVLHFDPILSKKRNFRLSLDLTSKISAQKGFNMGDFVSKHPLID